MRAANPKAALLHITRERLIFLAVVTEEVPPLEVLELLSRIHGVLSRYCCDTRNATVLTDDLLRSNFSTAILLLDEMMIQMSNRLYDTLDAPCFKN